MWKLRTSLFVFACLSNSKHCISPMSPFRIPVAGVILLLSFTGCSDSQPGSATEPEPEKVQTEHIQLDTYSTLIPVESDVVGVPSVIRFDGDSRLFVFDKSNARIVELDMEGQVVRTFGSRGRGPGEFQLVNRLFISDEYVVAVDFGQYVIQRFKRDGSFDSSFNYGEISGVSSAPPAPVSTTAMYAERVVAQPAVSPNGVVLVRPKTVEGPMESIFDSYTWEGAFMGGMGTPPEGSTAVLDLERMRSEIESGVIPSYHRADAIAIVDEADPGGWVLIETSFPHVLKLDEHGGLVREWDVEGVDAFEEQEQEYFEKMSRLMKEDPRMRLDPRHYVSGVGARDGRLFLATAARSPMIHEFDAFGRLVHIFEFPDEEPLPLPVFDVDVSTDRLFVVMLSGDIRAYDIR